MNSPPGEASATGVLVLLAQNTAWHSTQLASQASPRMLPEALMLVATLAESSLLNCVKINGRCVAVRPKHCRVH